MKFTEEPTIFDNNGYQLLPKNFTEKGFEFKEIHADGDWRIFERKGENHSTPHFELVKIYKSEEYEMGGNKIGKKWNLPTSEQWGVSGFTLPTKDRALAKLDEIKNGKVEDAQAKIENNKAIHGLILPSSEKFSLKDIEKLNPSLTYPVLYLKVKDMIGKKLEICGEVKNLKGRPSKLFKLI